MEPTYVYANIRLPILVNSDENLEPLSEYLTIEFDSCDKLPEKPEKGIDYSVIIEKLRELLHTSTMDEEELAKFQQYPPDSYDCFAVQDNYKDFPTSNVVTENGKELYFPKGGKGFEGSETAKRSQPGSHDCEAPWLLGVPKESGVPPNPSDKEVMNNVEKIPIVNKKLFVTRDEIKRNHKQIKQNYTAKQRPRKIKNFTMRTREELKENIENTIFNALDTAFGSSQQQEAQELELEDGQ